LENTQTENDSNTDVFGSFSPSNMGISETSFTGFHTGQLNWKIKTKGNQQAKVQAQWSRQAGNMK
ncbi:hypothetical protein, partial [Sphaerochaeta sp.]|uniref:hypothetical protein n=1 Tax=Sphaerochaeta sp. TaxID=1972642 RepID=UPI002A35A2E2